MGLQTQVYDDGSTLTWDDDTGFRTASQATDYQVNRASAAWTPQSVNPAASSWDQVLQFGLARLIDAKTRPVQPENTVPVRLADGTLLYQSAKTYVGPQVWVWVALAALVGFVAFGKKSA